MKPKAIIWLTGVITQYSIEPNYTIEDLTINKKLLTELSEKYDLLAITYYLKDTDEKEQYKRLFVNEQQAHKLKFLFIEYNNNITPDFPGLIKQILRDVHGVTHYIDYDKKRLYDAALNGIKNTNCIHISQLLD